MSAVSIPRVLRDAERRFCKHGVWISAGHPNTLVRGKPLKPLTNLLHRRYKTLRTRGRNKLIRLTAEEYAHLKKQSKVSGLSGEALIRSLITGIDVKPIPSDQLSEIRHQLSAIGNNINQIARIANRSDHIDKEDIDAIKSMQAQIWLQVKAF